MRTPAKAAEPARPAVYGVTFAIEAPLSRWHVPAMDRPVLCSAPLGACRRRPSAPTALHRDGTGQMEARRVFVIVLLSTSSTSIALRSCQRSPAVRKVEGLHEEGK